MGETNYTSTNLAIESHIQFLVVNAKATVAMKLEVGGRSMVGTFRCGLQCQHTSAYVNIRLYTSAYVCIFK